jgi:hypothetical protein
VSPSTRRLVPLLAAAALLVVVVAVLGVARLVDASDDGDDGTTAGSSGSTGPSASSGSGSSGSSALPGSSGSDGDGRSGQGGMAPPSAPATEPGPDDPMTRFTRTMAGADGRSVEVTFYGGVDTCYRYAVRADESAQEVALSLREERTSDGPCIDLAQEYRRSVPLDAPLGDRQVVDAATGDVLLSP